MSGKRPVTGLALYWRNLSFITLIVVLATWSVFWPWGQQIRFCLGNSEKGALLVRTLSSCILVIHCLVFIVLIFRKLIETDKYTHPCLVALCPGLTGWAGTRKVKPIWILLEQETVSGSGISWAIRQSAPHSREITTPAPHNSVFCRPAILPANRQRQITEGN